MATKLPRPSLVDTAIDTLRQSIEDGSWPVGHKLPVESTLAEQLGVSRNSLREAVRVLVHVGLLETRQGDGTYVRRKLDPAECLRRLQRCNLRDQLEMRIALESEAARLAAQRREESDLVVMREMLAKRHAAGDNINIRVDYDQRFHQAIVQAAHNPALTALYAYFSEAVAATIEQTERDNALPEPTHADHEYLLGTLELGDPQAAEQAVRIMLAPALRALNTP
tara:strand:+ start:2345 stop:3016 length:672 start_codon:yes stop_codon:yes gene_type:complete